MNEVKITVTMREDGKIAVEAPAGDAAQRLFCLGLLDMAKEVIKKHEPSRIVPVPGSVLPVR